MTLEENAFSIGLWVRGFLGILSTLVVAKINTGDTMMFGSPLSSISVLSFLLCIIMSWQADKIEIYHKFFSGACGVLTCWATVVSIVAHRFFLQVNKVVSIFKNYLVII